MLRFLLIVCLLLPLAASMFLDAVWLFYSFKLMRWMPAMETEPWAYLNPLYLTAAWLVWNAEERRDV